MSTIFRYMDEGITATNREKAKAVIWSDMDDDDIDVFVEVIIGSAKKSRIVATAVRQVSKSYAMLRLGIITGPRFMATVKHYQNHGGFVLPFFGSVQRYNDDDGTIEPSRPAGNDGTPDPAQSTKTI